MRREVERIGLRVQTSLEPAPVVGDPGLLDRLAGNLIENAVRYNHLHGRLWVRTGTDGDRSWLVVGNTGFEVDQADVPGLFEPFRRGGRERTGARGSGLGLSIVRAVCDAHGGTVTGGRAGRRWPGGDGHPAVGGRPGGAGRRLIGVAGSARPMARSRRQLETEGGASMSTNVGSAPRVSVG